MHCSLSLPPIAESCSNSSLAANHDLSNVSVQKYEHITRIQTPKNIYLYYENDTDDVYYIYIYIIMYMFAFYHMYRHLVDSMYIHLYACRT